MKVGSICVCINNGCTKPYVEREDGTKDFNMTPLITPALDTPYTCRAILLKGEFMFTDTGIKCRSLSDQIWLEEIVNERTLYNGHLLPEQGYPLENFRELLPPAELEELLKEREPNLVEI